MESVRVRFVCSVVDSLRQTRKIVVPRCDVIKHADDPYRNATRFFTSAAQPPPPSTDDVTDDVTAWGFPGVTLNDVMPATRMTFRLVLVCLDAMILLYRVCRVLRVVNRMLNCWSRDDRKCYYYDDDDDDEEDYSLSGMVATDRTKQSSPGSTGRTELDRGDETLYQLPTSSSSSRCVESQLVCRLIRSPYVAKLVLFAALVTSCHVTLQVIDSWRVSAHINLSTLVSDPSLTHLDSDVQTTYRRQRDDMMTSFNQFVVNSLSHLSIMIQLINNGHFSLLSIIANQYYTVSQKNCATFLSELCQTSINCENFWHRDDKDEKLM